MDLPATQSMRKNFRFLNFGSSYIKESPNCRGILSFYTSSTKFVLLKANNFKNLDVDDCCFLQDQLRKPGAYALEGRNKLINDDLKCSLAK